MSGAAELAHAPTPPMNRFGRPVTGSPGSQMTVDYEDRVNPERLRRDRLERATASLERSEFGALLLFDHNNIRYLTGTHIGEWARDKMARYAILPRGSEPILWDFGSAAASHRLYAPWLPVTSWKAGVTGMRGSMPPSAGMSDVVAQNVADVMKACGVVGLPVGIDILDVPLLKALEKRSIEVVDGQQAMLAARRIKTIDELALLDRAAGMVDGVYHHIYTQWLRPGVRENDLVGEVSRMLYEMGSDEVEAVNAVSGERCSPHPHVFSDRMIRPGDTAYFDIIQAYNGYRTCYYRTFSVGWASPGQLDAYARCREWIDKAIDVIRPGASTADVAAVWPKAEQFGFASEEECFGLQFGHGVGLALWEPPIISRLHSFEHPEVLEAGMVIAIETFCPSHDGASAARIEEELIVTTSGCEVITRFPAAEPLIAARY